MTQLQLRNSYLQKRFLKFTCESRISCSGTLYRRCETAEVAEVCSNGHIKDNELRGKDGVLFQCPEKVSFLQICILHLISQGWLNVAVENVPRSADRISCSIDGRKETTLLERSAVVGKGKRKHQQRREAKTPNTAAVHSNVCRCTNSRESVWENQ